MKLLEEWKMICTCSKYTSLCANYQGLQYYFIILYYCHYYDTMVVIIINIIVICGQDLHCEYSDYITSFVSTRGSLE
jgi:hypothetical protein